MSNKVNWDDLNYTQQRHHSLNEALARRNTVQLVRPFVDLAQQGRLNTNGTTTVKLDQRWMNRVNKALSARFEDFKPLGLVWRFGMAYLTNTGSDYDLHISWSPNLALNDFDRATNYAGLDEQVRNADSALANGAYVDAQIAELLKAVTKYETETAGFFSSPSVETILKKAKVLR